MAPVADDRSEDGLGAIPDCGDAIDGPTFEQILDMDDDSEREFSRGIVFGFFDQAATTFTEMKQALEKEDLLKLSQLGHFLKGSSATLGLTKVKDSCEKIQNLGHQKDEAGEDVSWENKKFLQKIKDILPVVLHDYEDAKKRLVAFYGSEEE